MQEAEVKRVRPKKPEPAPKRDPNLNGGARGGDKEATEPEPQTDEIPLIQRYSE